MFEYYLSNKNEHATVASKSKFTKLNQGVLTWLGYLEPPLLISFHSDLSTRIWRGAPTSRFSRPFQPVTSFRFSNQHGRLRSSASFPFGSGVLRSIGVIASLDSTTPNLTVQLGSGLVDNFF